MNVVQAEVVVRRATPPADRHQQHEIRHERHDPDPLAGVPWWMAIRLREEGRIAKIQGIPRRHHQAQRFRDVQPEQPDASITTQEDQPWVSP